MPIFTYCIKKETSGEGMTGEFFPQTWKTRPPFVRNRLQLNNAGQPTAATREFKDPPRCFSVWKHPSPRPIGVLSGLVVCLFETNRGASGLGSMPIRDQSRCFRAWRYADSRPIGVLPGSAVCLFETDQGASGLSGMPTGVSQRDGNRFGILKTIWIGE